MPVNPDPVTNEGTVNIDGGSYTMYVNVVTTTGDPGCGQSSFSRYFSIRETARSCGTISVTQHFDAWESVGMKLGNLIEAKILVEVGGGSGSIDFPIARITATP